MTCIVSQSRYMYTDPQIRYDTTLLLDMHARHPHTLVSTLHECCSSMDMVLDDTLTTVMTCTSDTQIYYTDYCYTYMFHWYTEIPIHILLHSILLLSSLHECLVHSYLMVTHPCHICSPHECTCMCCFYFLVIRITVHITCIIVPCYPCIPLI